MEIREGIKFKSIYTSNTEFVLDKIEKNNLISRDNGEYKYTFEDVIANFKKDIWKLTYYPYKEGDYCIRTWPSGKKTLGIAYSFMGTDLYFKSLENYAEEGGVIENYTYGLLQDPFRGIYQRPAFKDEIPKENIMNKEELLAEAKRRYPIGTKVRPLNLNTIDEIKNHDISNFIPQDNCVWFEGYKNGLLVYCNGKCAEIIESPKESEDIYYEYIMPNHGNIFTKGKHYKIINPDNLEAYENFINNQNKPDGFAGVNWKHFKLVNKTENMNDLDKELKERESKLEKSTVNVKWNVVFPEIGAKEVYRTSNNKIKPNLIKHNNSRFQKLLIIRTNKSKHSGKTK